MKTTLLLTLVIALACVCSDAQSAPTEGVVDRVYHPYILPFERELEWRFMSRQKETGNELLQRFAYGHALSETVIAKFYAVGSRDQQHDNFSFEGYELELRWMVTEQGKYWADIGTLFEYEKFHDEKRREVTTGLVMEKEFGQTSLTVNALLVYEWGEVPDQELKTQLRAKYRYRWMPLIQPAIELYSGDDFIGVGPAFMGIQRFDNRRQLRWELGFIAELNGVTKDHTLRFSLEYEF